jgi:hypothetical protein
MEAELLIVWFVSAEEALYPGGELNLRPFFFA